MAEQMRDWRALATRLDQNGATSEWRQLVSSVQARVFYNDAAGAYLKLFYEQRPRNRLKVALFPGLARHRHFVRNSLTLRRLGFTAPKVLGSGELGGSSHGHCGFVATEAFHGMGFGSFAAGYLVRSAHDGRIRRWKRRVMELLGREVARLHNAGISHGDLRPDNVLLSCDSPTPLFCFIDNERNRAHAFRIPYRARLRNLSQLNMLWSEELSGTYRLRFIKAYLAATEASLNDRKLIRRVQEISQRRMQGKARGGYLKSAQRQMCRPDFAAIFAESPP